MKATLRIGTRGSALALYQAELAKTKIERDFPLVVVEIVKIKTSGDMIRRGVVNPFETKRVYTREIEEALLKKEIDLAVHSAKDLAVQMPDGLKIGAVLEREDARDCLINLEKKKLSELAMGARVGTSALRRRMQIQRLNPQVSIEDVHGNVDTRIRKLEDGEHDALCLAYAGVKRLGLVNHVSEVFPEEMFYPAGGQGVIVVQCRALDAAVDEILEPVHHRVTGKMLDCERAFLKKLGGGRQLPCGIYTKIESHVLTAAGALFSTEERKWVEDKVEGSSENPAEVGERLGEMILAKGGSHILEKMRYAVEKKKKFPSPLEGED